MPKTITNGKLLTSCPIVEIIPELKAALREHPAVVLQAPGSGKTIRIPLALLDVIEPQQGRILMLEPRRIAAVSAARWMAKTIGVEDHIQPGGLAVSGPGAPDERSLSRRKPAGPLR